MRRWRVKCVKAHELPCGHEMQNVVLRCGKNIKRVGGVKTVGSYLSSYFAYILYIWKGEG